MSYASEPYAQFVEDLLLSLTGGITRQEFRFQPENVPFRLTSPAPVIPSSVQIFGQAGGAYRRFRPRTDYALLDDLTIQWKARADGTPAADAVWPDDATSFYANFEIKAEGGAAPLLTDRNPGSVVRLLSESFAREFAVLSRQLEAVYQAGFVDTATGRDLDQLAVLVGVARRNMTFAAGTVVFGRSTPAPADIFIPAGARVSTSQPPAVVFETTEPATIRRGNLSVEAAVQALVPGSDAILPANALTVINRPILGVETLANPQPTSFASSAEDDAALRSRVRRALEGAGQATTGALLAALTGISGLREKDIQISEDPLAHPGVVQLRVALPEMDPAAKLQALEEAIDRIEATRPVGIRILHNIDAPQPLGPATPGSGSVPDEGGNPASVGSGNPDDLFLPVNVVVRISPTTLSLTAQQRNDLAAAGEKVVRAFLADAGIGEILIYNRLVAELMALDGVLDVAVEMYPQANPEQPHRKNLFADNPAVRPNAGVIDVQVGNALVMLDIAVAITLKGTGLIGDPATAHAVAHDQILQQLQAGLLQSPPADLNPGALLALLQPSDTYDVGQLHYKVEYQDAGVRVHQQDAPLKMSGIEQLWVRRVTVGDV